MKEYKVTNKTYMTIPINIGTDIFLLEARGQNNTVVVSDLTGQLKNLRAKGLIKIREMK